MRLLLALLLVCLGALAGEPGAVGAEGGVVEGRYVRVQGKVPAHWLDTAAELGDALFERMKADLGRAPEKTELPLELTLYPSREAFALALPRRNMHEKGRRGGPPGGWTSWHPCRSLVWLQGEAFDTRRLILHELVHQFYARARPVSRRGREGRWYREGLAEWYGWHRFGERGIEFGVFDLAVRNTTPKRIPARTKRKDWHAWNYATGEIASNYKDALALVGALRGTEHRDLRARFRRFEADVFSRGGTYACFERHFKGLSTDVHAAVQEYWTALDERTWIARGREWDETQDGIEVTALPVAVGSPGWLGGDWRRLAVRVELRDPTVRAGVVFTDARGHGHDVAVELSRGRVAVVAMGDAFGAAARRPKAELQTTELSAKELPVLDRYELSLRREGTHLVVAVRHGDATSTHAFELGRTNEAARAVAARPHLLVRGGRARFRGLTQDARTGPPPAKEPDAGK